MIRFPRSIDQFPELVSNEESQDVLKARTANDYQDAIVTCQATIESVFTKNIRNQQKMLGMVFRFDVSINATTNIRPGITIKDTAENGGRAHYYFSPLMPDNSFVTLGIPTDYAADIPNTNPFHPKNTHLVTVETQVWSYLPGNNVRGMIIEEEKHLQQHKAGGAWVRDGMLYHNGETDMNPKYVLGDWTLHIVENGISTMDYSFFVHYVIIG